MHRRGKPRRWVGSWHCPCGAEGDGSTIKKQTTSSGRVLMLCPECGRRVEFASFHGSPRKSSPRRIDDARAAELRNCGFTLREIAEELCCSYEGVRLALKRAERESKE
jgi:hypothetical protein